MKRTYFIIDLLPISSMLRDVERFTKSQLNCCCNSLFSFIYWLTIAEPCTGGGKGVMNSMRCFCIKIICNTLSNNIVVYPLNICRVERSRNISDNEKRSFGYAQDDINVEYGATSVYYFVHFSLVQRYTLNSKNQLYNSLNINKSRICVITATFFGGFKLNFAFKKSNKV